MSNAYNCMLLWCFVNLVTAEYSTIRPHRHHQQHSYHHKHRSIGISEQNVSTTEHTQPMDMVNAASSTAQAPSSDSVRSQKLFLVSSSHHHHQQQPQPQSFHQLPSTSNAVFQADLPRWPTAASNPQHPHSYHHHHQHHHQPHQRTTDFGFEARTRGSPRTFHADMPYTTGAPSLQPAAGVTVITAAQWPQQSPRPDHRASSKPYIGRHVCSDIRTLLQPVVSKREPCGHSQLCKNSRSPYENSIYHHQRSLQTAYNCCPGWARINKNSVGCNKPLCKTMCKNGGKCIKPDTCKCPSGYSGKYCEVEINECITEKPCDQLCFNTEGSYYCQCRDGFALQEDKQSCKKIPSHVNDVDHAFEARDLEDDVDIEDLAYKINQIQKKIDGDQQANVDVNKRIVSIIDMMNNMKMRMDGVENRQNELNFIRDRLKSYETQFNKLQYAVDYLYKCRMHPSIYCP